MSTNKEYPPDVISKSFIKQYYELMCTNPSELYRFYKDDSCFTHTEGYQIAEVINGTEKIRNFVRELDIAGARFNLADGSVDAHRGENNGVFVLVTGYVTPKGTDAVRQFVQSFFLAVQAENSAAYYVRNSVFRLFEPSAPSVSTGVSTATVSTGVNPTPPAAPAAAPEAEVPKETPAPAPEPPAPRESKKRGKKESPMAAPVPAPAPAPAAEPAATEQSAMIMESVVVLIEDVTGERPNSDLSESIALQQIGEQLAELTEESMGSKDVDSGPKSYADLFKRSQEAAAAPAPAAAPKKGRSASGGRTRADPAPAPVKAEAAAPAPSSKPVTSSSLFVKQLPAEITEADLLSIFVGASKADIHSSKGYGFVEFPEPVFAASTMTRFQEDPSVFSYNGQRLRVEERTVQPRSAAGSKPSAGQTRKPADRADKGGKGGNAAPRKNVANGKSEKSESGWNVKGSGNKK